LICFYRPEIQHRDEQKPSKTHHESYGVSPHLFHAFGMVVVVGREELGWRGSSEEKKKKLREDLAE